MKLPNLINLTNKVIKPTNHLFNSTMVSGLLTLMVCTMLTPKIKNHAANYIDPRQPATDQAARDADPGYNWFY
ncbi:MAG TPA: hypothetical protein VHY59_01800 [Chthoniobacterales bacterium]|nr:hypothetical protein [Chthoniobacterales bacterium]